MTRTVIEGARIVTQTGVERGCLVVDGDRIESVAPTDPPSDPTRRIDADGKHLLPGLVDLHGDDIERHVFPRSEARVPAETALDACDRTALAAGITTKFHAVAFEETPTENRSLHLARELRNALADTEGLGARHRFHARCEVSDPDCVDAVHDAIESGGVSLVSLMNHAPGTGQFEDVESFERRYADGSGGAEWDAKSFARRRDCEEPVLDARVERIADRAREAGVPVASHDDERPGTVERMRRRGVSISEFPVTEAAAEAATAEGMTTVMGAPNLIRGGSLWGNLDVSTAIEADTVDVLCSDYRPQSLLRAPFVDTGESLHRRVARVTSAPADAVGLDDKGRIEAGAVADLILVDSDPRPSVTHAFVSGDLIYRFENGETVS